MDGLLDLRGMFGEQLEAALYQAPRGPGQRSDQEEQLVNDGQRLLCRCHDSLGC